MVEHRVVQPNMASTSEGAPVLLEGHILDDGRQLVVITEQDDTLQSRSASFAVYVLQQHSEGSSQGQQRYMNDWNKMAQPRHTRLKRNDDNHKRTYGMKVSISRIWADSSMIRLSYWNRKSMKAPRRMAAWVHVIAMTYNSIDPHIGSVHISFRVAYTQVYPIKASTPAAHAVLTIPWHAW